MDDIAPWVPPRETKYADKIKWASLHTLDLGQVQGEDYSEVPAPVVEDVGAALQRDGFIYAINHGLPYEQVLRMFSIAQYTFDQVSEQDKQQFTADIARTGSFCGYKQAGHWKIDGVGDRIEQWNFGSAAYGPEVAAEKYPERIRRFLGEIQAFARFNHNVIARKLLSVLSLVLKVPYNYLWNLSQKYETDGGDFLRFSLGHRPSQEEERAVNGVRIQGHTDFGCVSLLWSQPIASLEILGRDNVWRTVAYRPNALVVNLGDLLFFLSGGYLQATIHRVVAPPEDQQHYPRIGIFYFAAFDNDVELLPIAESPVAQEAYKGKQFWAERLRNGEPIPTSREWNNLRTSRYGQQHSKLGADGHHHETIAGHHVTLYNDVGGARVG